MKVLSLKVLGVSTEKYDEMIAMLSGALGLKKVSAEEEFSAFETEDGDIVEVFRKGSPGAHQVSSPVAGFLVDDMDAAVSRLKSSGMEMIGPLHTGKGGHRWQAFRGPDGNVYEITYTRDSQ